MDSWLGRFAARKFIAPAPVRSIIVATAALLRGSVYISWKLKAFEMLAKAVDERLCWLLFSNRSWHVFHSKPEFQNLLHAFYFQHTERSKITGSHTKQVLEVQRQPKLGSLCYWWSIHYLQYNTFQWIRSPARTRKQSPKLCLCMGAEISRTFHPALQLVKQQYLFTTSGRRSIYKSSASTIWLRFWITAISSNNWIKQTVRTEESYLRNWDCNLPTWLQL